MKIQRSFLKKNHGAIYVVPTPIGNLEDITFRALRILKESSLIAAEDTRRTKQLLNHFEIKTPLISYHEHNKENRDKEILNDLKQGKKIALVSDAGMPAISDPGAELIQQVIQSDLPVIVLPGANAALCALVGSGLATNEFLFYGFLPRRRKSQEAELNRLKSLQATIIFYESPYRIKATLEMIRKQMGDRQIAIARELTKRYEEYIRGEVSEVLAELATRKLRGEFCLVVSGSTAGEQEKESLWWSHLSIIDHVNHHLEKEDLSNRDAIERVANDRQMSRREVYQLFHKNRS